MNTLYKYFLMKEPSKPFLSLFERQLEHYKQQLLAEYEKTRKIPFYRENEEIVYFLEKYGWMWNQFLKFCGLPLNNEYGIWKGRKGLEKAKERALKFFNKNKKSPLSSCKRFITIHKCTNRGYWKAFGINNWNDFLFDCGLPINQMIFENEKDSLIYRIFISCKKRSRKKGISFELTFGILKESNLLFEPCVICDIVGFSKTRHKNPVCYNGLDRIDNTRGYEINNIQTMCWECNKIKNVYSLEQLAGEIGDKMIALINFAKNELKISFENS